MTCLIYMICPLKEVTGLLSGLATGVERSASVRSLFLHSQALSRHPTFTANFTSATIPIISPCKESGHSGRARSLIACRMKTITSKTLSASWKTSGLSYGLIILIGPEKKIAIISSLTGTLVKLATSVWSFLSDGENDSVVATAAHNSLLSWIDPAASPS